MTGAVEKLRTGQDYLNVLKRRKFELFLPALIVLSLAIIVAFTLPATYESQATILIEEQEIPLDFVRTTISSYADQRVQVISQRVLTVESISAIIEKFSLYREQGSGSDIPSTELASDFRDNVDLDLVSAEVIDPRSGRPTEATIAFTLAFTAPVAATAQQVTSELVTLFLNENLRDRAKRMANAEEFLDMEANKLNKELLAMEQRLADFKTENEGSLPELQGFNLSILERTEREMSDLKRRVQELNKRKIELVAQLAQLSPSAPVQLATGEMVLSSADRLKALQSEHRGKAAIYRDNHPDVVRLEREINALQVELGIGTDVEDLRKQLLEQQRRLSDMQAKYKDNHQDIQSTKHLITQLENSIRNAPRVPAASNAPKADNPAYILLDTELKAVQSEMRSLDNKQVELKTKIDHYEGLLKRAPEVERNYQALQRDYNNATLKYQEIKAKQREATASKNLEREQKGERFTLIEPPALPSKPVSPNRPAIVFLGFLLASAAGLGLVVIRETLDEAVHGVHQLAAIVGEAPLVVIQYIYNDDDIMRTRRFWKIGVAAALSVALLFVFYLHFFYRPLDVLYFVTKNSLGLG